MSKVADTPACRARKPMIIAVVAVWVVQPPVNEIVDMIAVRNLFVSAIWTMRV